MRGVANWLGRLRPAVGLSVVLLAAMVGGLAATAPIASAQGAVSCTRTGDTLDWTPTYRVHVRGSQTAGDNSVWLTTFTGAIGNQVSSYVITNADKAKAPGDTFFIRYRAAGEVINVECTSVVDPPLDDLVCTQSGTVLTWSQLDVSRNVFHVRSVNPDGSTSWVQSVAGADTNSFDVASADVSHEIRYRITFSPGDTRTFNVPCTIGDNPTPVSCTTSFFGFMQETGFDVEVDGLADGIRYTLFLNGEEIRSNEFPVEVIPFIGAEANELFRVDNFGDTFYEVEIAPSDDLSAKISCGSTGTERLPVSSCSIQHSGIGEIQVYVSPERTLGFEIAIDGVITPSNPEFSPQPGGPVIYYEVEGDPRSVFTIVQDAGDVGCTGDEVNFCDQAADGWLVWLGVPNVWNDEYNVRRINADGSSSWVATTFFNTAYQTDGGEFLIRYRMDDGAGNLTVMNHTCVQD